jgi:hypothetical protein
VDFFHHRNDVVQMLDDVISLALLEPIVGERPGHAIQVMAKVGIRGGDNVDVYGVGRLLASATEAQFPAIPDYSEDFASLL